MPISSARFSPKTDNNRQAFAAKVQIRKSVMAAIGKPAVFDAYAGAGEMYAAVWKDAQSYVGCDLKYRPMTADKRMMFSADNVRVLRAIDLSAFNIIDMDAHGSPWHQAAIVADRRPVKKGETIGLVLTDGAGVAFVGNQLPHAAAMLAGLRGGAMVGLLRNRDAILQKIVAGLVRRMRCEIVKRWEAHGRSGGKAGNSQLRYIGLVLRGRDNAAKVA